MLAWVVELLVCSTFSDPELSNRESSFTTENAMNDPPNREIGGRQCPSLTAVAGTLLTYQRLSFRGFRRAGRLQRGAAQWSSQLSPRPSWLVRGAMRQYSTYPRSMYVDESTSRLAARAITFRKSDGLVVLFLKLSMQQLVIQGLPRDAAGTEGKRRRPSSISKSRYRRSRPWKP